MLQKGTITIAPFGEAVTGEDAAQVLLVQRIGCHSRKFADSSDLFRTHPDIARRAGAAIATLRTGKTQPVLIPWFFASVDGHTAIVRSRERFASGERLPR